MERQEYATLRDLEESFWWYRGLHQLVTEAIDQAATELERSTSIIGRESGNRIRILDAGCGTGGLLQRLQDRFTTSGIDFSPHAVTLASARGLPRLSRASVSGLPFPEKYFDIVSSLDVLYHRGVPDDQYALGELARVLRPGGRVILNLPAFEFLRSSHDEAIHTARRYRRRQLREKLEIAGLRPIRLTHWNGFLFPALAIVRLLRRNKSGGPVPAKSDVSPVPAPINWGLERALELERHWLRWGDLPFGLSILAVAERETR